ncbi:hypothetical protein D1871_07920 [Nakamurella silvestris]|nr:hypothetical protein D1871_07920 [Nakamurella silvestris]
MIRFSHSDPDKEYAPSSPEVPQEVLGVPNLVAVPGLAVAPPSLPGPPARPPATTPLQRLRSAAELQRSMLPSGPVIRRTVLLTDTGTAVHGKGDLPTALPVLTLKEQQTLRRLADDPDVEFRFASEADLRTYLQTKDPTLFRTVEAPKKGAKRQRPNAPADTVFQFSESGEPDYMHVPQSPFRDDGERSEIEIPVSEPLEDLHQGLADQRKLTVFDSGIGKSATKNIFQFRIDLQFRITRIEPATGDKWLFHNDTETTGTADVSSAIYQSGAKKNDRPVPSDGSYKNKRKAETTASALKSTNEAEYKTRQGVSAAAAQSGRFDQFAPTGAQAYARRGGKNDWTMADERDANGEYELDGNQLGSQCFHSETQALGHSPEDLPVLMTDLIHQMTEQAQNVGVQHVIVLNSLHVQGASNPNTVCGNACKPALTLLLERILDEFEQQVQGYGDSNEADGCFIRESEGFAGFMNVTGVKKFQGMGTGAVRTPTITKPTHGVVNEFRP